MLQTLKTFKPDKDKYYLLCPAGLGDTFMCCGYKDALEKKVGEKIYFIVRKKHEIILKLFKDINYVVLDFNAVDLCDMPNKALCLTKGEIFIGHIDYYCEIWQFLGMSDMYEGRRIQFKQVWPLLFRLPMDTAFTEPEQELNFEPSIEFKTKIQNINTLDKIILLNPEANCCNFKAEEFWQDLIDEISAQGYTIIINAIKDCPVFKRAIKLDMSLEEALWLGIKCQGVYSIRNGLTDLLCFYQKNLHLFYPDYENYYIYNFRDLFNLKFEEKIVALKYLENKIINNKFKKSFYLFDKIRILTFIQVGAYSHYKILGIPIFTIKKVNSSVWYKILGIPILKIKKAIQ